MFLVLIEMVLLNTQKICFGAEIRKIFFLHIAAAKEVISNPGKLSL